MSYPREYKLYVSSVDYVEARLWESGFPMGGITVSDRDKRNGSPKWGDMIARLPNDHNVQWLINETYFKANYSLESSVPEEIVTPNYPEDVKGKNK